MSRMVRAGAAPAVGLVLLAWGTASTLLRAGDTFQDQPKRLWEDMGLAVGCCLTGEFPVTYNPFRKYWDADERPRYTEPRGVLARTVADRGIRPWEFWRAVPWDEFRRPRPPQAFPRFDDAGRPVLLCLLFRAVGGVAPFLVFWLGFLVAVPLVCWIALECLRSGRGMAGGTFLVLVGLSAFVVEILALPYAAIGFYVLGILVLVAVAVYASLGQPTPRGLCVRMTFAGLALTVCALGRSSCLLLVPGFAAALGIGLARSAHGRLVRSGGLGVVGLILLLLPYAVASQQLAQVTDRTLQAHGDPRAIPQHHPVWFNLWVGLGDFDRTKGYVWADDVASAVVVAHGGSPITPSFLDPQDEEILRDLMLADIRTDPLWYAGILGKRLLATLTQWKLRPWSPRDGHATAPRDHPNEGQIDSYYALTATVDHFGAGAHRLEVPISVLILPTWFLVTVGCLRRRGGADRDRARGSLRVLLCVAAGTLPLPVLVTTAGGLETEAFALTYLLGIAFSLEETTWWWRGRRARSSLERLAEAARG